MGEVFLSGANMARGWDSTWMMTNNEETVMIKRTIALAVVALLAAAGAAQADVSISVVNAAALQGSWGMRANFDGTNTNAYVQDNSPNNEADYFVTFRVRTDGMSMNNTTSINIFRAYEETSGSQAFRINIFRTNPGAAQDYALHVLPARDAGSGGGFYPRLAAFVRGAPSRPLGDQFTIEWHKGASTTLNLYRNGTLNKTVSGLSTNDFDVDYVRLGALGNQINNALAGSFLDLDDFISTRTPQF